MERKDLLIIILVLLISGVIGYLIYAKNKNLMGTEYPESTSNREVPSLPVQPTPAPAPESVVPNSQPGSSSNVTEDEINELDSMIKNLDANEPVDQDLLID